ncbi:hypothetical protein LSTR_LSTR000465 [Laodelphax striatellus]|uniref:CLIC N-terminal domain-containing protein n=1 Tax=Laodelphax striatellus TaxID=195883 RepID=A0A482X1R1_LAOST|nr:hypothetical protein LSTR_LSTR000465 [Laodelphax striatellus]
MSEDTNQNGTENGSVTEIELIIKASTIDGRRKGACLFCQEYFMDLYLLAELKTISLKVTTVDMQKPPPDFRTNFEATPPPILIDNGLAVLENEKIERHIMKNVPGGHNLFVQDKEVATLIENLYSKLKLMLLKKDDVSTNSLMSHLRKIDEHLGRKNTRFLTGDTMCCFDCELMPRLQHIRVAAGKVNSLRSSFPPVDTVQKMLDKFVVRSTGLSMVCYPPLILSAYKCVSETAVLPTTLNCRHSEYEASRLARHIN